MSLSFLRQYLTPHFGRFNLAQLRALGQSLLPCGFFAVGPVVVLIDLPARWRKPEDEISLVEINAILRENEAASATN